MTRARDHSTGGEPTNETLLRDYGPRRSAGFGDWPEVVHKQLSGLVDMADEAGANTTRSELVAALVSFTELDGQGLLDVIQRYRTGTVGDLNLGSE
jgi:hypothetical protein